MKACVVLACNKSSTRRSQLVGTKFCLTTAPGQPRNFMYEIIRSKRTRGLALGSAQKTIEFCLKTESPDPKTKTAKTNMSTLLSQPET